MERVRYTEALRRRVGRKINNNSGQGEKDQTKYKEVVATGFPRTAIKGLAKEYADLYSQNLESPWAFCFLTCLGVVVCDSVSLASALPI